MPVGILAVLSATRRFPKRRPDGLVRHPAAKSQIALQESKNKFYFRIDVV